MATTTPNFGWPVPTSTDLVKDGATAIEALGDSIDASLLDLKGGTTGQVLAKASGTDMDFSWVAQDDSNAIQNAIVDAKGDLIAATAADTPARFAVGTNYNVLSAQSGETTGLLWAGTPISFTPTWTMDAGSPSIGNGNMTMTYVRYGKFCNIQFLFQAGSTTTFGTSGNFYFTLPFTAKTSGLNAAISGGFYAEDYAVAGYSGLTGLSGDGTKMFLKIPQSANAAWGKTTPFTWATNDFFNGTFNYEVA